MRESVKVHSPSYSESQSNQSHLAGTAQTTKWQSCVLSGRAEVSLAAGGTKPATDSVSFKIVIESIWPKDEVLFMCFQCVHVSRVLVWIHPESFATDSPLQL